MTRLYARLLIALGSLLAFDVLAAPDAVQEAREAQVHFSQLGGSDSPLLPPIPQEELDPILDRAEARATEAGRKVLQTGRAMIAARDIVLGSCWDYINAVYNRAGYPAKGRATAHKGKFKTGPYAAPSDLQPGDWLYYVNHSYGDGEHSGIFVEWTDFAAREALILSYPGEKRPVPGRYSYYDLSDVYTIIRPKGTGIATPAGAAAPNAQGAQSSAVLGHSAVIDALFRQ